ncbi:MAG: hypothetical protein JO298_08675 [Verrucomicrobia bacterium]|nr:hypothetical protein [Verrucomicrobiota bacterium]
MKLPFDQAMRGTVIKSLFIAFFMTSVPAFADTLVVGSVYFDSVQTLNEVSQLSAQHDNEGIAKLIENGHVSHQTGAELDIVVLVSGSTPESPAEFRFLNGPTTYWTLTRNVANFIRSTASSIPVSTPTPTPQPKSLPAASPTATSKHYQRQHEGNAPFDDDNSQRTGHEVDGKWKWSPANKHYVPVKKASSFQTPTAQLEQKPSKHEPFVIQRLYPAARIKSDCEQALQIATQGDEAAMDKMIEQDRIRFFGVGTRVYPVKSTDMGTWWLIREKGSMEKWWINVRAFSLD